MKQLALILICVVTLYSCLPPSYRHSYNYSVEVTYSNTQKDTLTGNIVQPNSESSKCALYLALGSSGCMTVKNGLINYDRLACDVRSFKIIKEETTTTKN